jgi:hypothetical protein
MRFTVCRFVTSCFARGLLVACGPMEMRSELTQLVSAINTFDYLHLPGDTPTETLLEMLHPREDLEWVVKSVWQLAKSQKQLKPEESTYREEAKGLVADWYREYRDSGSA